MSVETLGVAIPIIAMIGAFVTIIFLRKYQNKERLSMLEKGVNPNFNATGSTSGSLRVSLLLIGAGIGLLLGYFLDLQFDMEEVGYFSMLFLFGGIGLGLSYIIEENKSKSKKADL